MRTVTSIDLEEARAIVEKGLAVAGGDGGKPVVIAVSDPNGDLVAFARMDGAPVRSVRLAINKAYTAARALSSTADLAQQLRQHGRDVLVYGDPSFTVFPGGAPIRLDNRTVIGAVGISGRVPEDDQRLADAVASVSAS